MQSVSIRWLGSIAVLLEALEAILANQSVFLNPDMRNLLLTEFGLCLLLNSQHY